MLFAILVPTLFFGLIAAFAFYKEITAYSITAIMLICYGYHIGNRVYERDKK